MEKAVERHTEKMTRMTKEEREAMIKYAEEAVELLKRMTGTHGKGE